MTVIIASGTGQTVPATFCYGREVGTKSSPSAMVERLELRVLLLLW
jgi:hypothetical protein